MLYHEITKTEKKLQCVVYLNTFFEMVFYEVTMAKKNYNVNIFKWSLPQYRGYVHVFNSYVVKIGISIVHEYVIIKCIAYTTIWVNISVHFNKKFLPYQKIYLISFLSKW